MQNGGAILEEEKTLKDYIARYQYNAKNEQINKFASLFNSDPSILAGGLKTWNIAKLLCRR